MGVRPLPDPRPPRVQRPPEAPPRGRWPHEHHDSAAPRTARAGGVARAGAAGGGALGSHAVSPSPAGEDAARERRNERWAMRRRLWELSSLERVRACGRVARTTGGPVLRVSGDAGQRRAGLAGLVSCGSPWACPTCAVKIGARRSEEIRQVIAGMDAAGGSAALITFTVRHHRGHPLAASWDALRYAWGGSCPVAVHGRAGHVRGGRLVRRRGGHLRRGTRTWHPHLHVLVMFDGPLSDDMIGELAGRWHLRFERAVARRGYTSGGAPWRPGRPRGGDGRLRGAWVRT